ncbi:hypothetical protein BD769DRAFT_1668647 [Suillus cothurnatus]|nr:hypothetical protein BD769DRAFT_1668647 [Suillus cothurnatus]
MSCIPPTALTPSSSDINSVSANKQPPLTLQAFYESLPRPFPESFESKDVNEFGAPGYMNTLIQNARGGKLTTTFIFASDGTSGRTYSCNHAHGYNLLYLPLRSESTISPSGPIPYPANAIDSISSPQSPSHQQEQPPPQILADYLTPHARFSSFYNLQPAPHLQAQFGLDYEMVEREDLGDRNPLCRRSGICSSTHARKLSGDWRSLGNQLLLRTYTTARTLAVQDHQEGREILSHAGVRLIEPELFRGYDPKKKVFNQEIELVHDLEAIEVAQSEAEKFKYEHGDKCDIWTGEGDQWFVKFKMGACVFVPKAFKLSRLVAGQIPNPYTSGFLA